MKNKIILILTVSLVILFVFQVNNGSFGDDSDPLISKSYFDKKLQEIDQKFKKYQNQTSTKTIEDKFIPLNMKKGQRIYFDEGTEFILRTGDASVLDLTGNGVPDLSSGNNLTHGFVVPKNHHLLSPRNDKRAIRCETDIWILIKGSYLIDDEDKAINEISNGEGKKDQNIREDIGKEDL